VSERRTEKERLREQRLERERAAALASRGRRRAYFGAGAVAVAGVIAAIVVALASSGGGGGGSGAGSAGGLRTTPAPWPAETNGLAQRAAALHLPQPSDTIFHIHAQLRVFVDGRQVTVPADIGIDASTRFITSLHTHDSTGIIHMEAVRRYPFTLGQFFTVWGVKFTRSQLGAYKAGGGKVLQVYADGRRIADPAAYVMKPHDSVVVGYGKPGSFPTKVGARFPPGY
jgi:hypothetical protein